MPSIRMRAFVRLTAEIDPDLAQRFREECQLRGLSIGKGVAEAIALWLEQKGKGKGEK